MPDRDRVVEGIVAWCATAGESMALRAGVLDRLGDAISFDGGFFAAVDPATLLYTSGVRRDMPTDATAAFIRTEFAVTDVNQLRQLARAPSPIGWLDAATKGDRAASLRYREAMRPIGLGDELRVALRVDGSCWGLLCLHRADTTRGFASTDAELLGRLGPHLAEGLRRTTVLAETVADTTTDGPGVIVVSPDGDVEATTPAAARWLQELAEFDTPDPHRLPTVIASVVQRVHAIRRAAGVNSLIPRARVRLPSGRWLIIHASELGRGTPGRTAVVIEPATAPQIAPLIIAAYALTSRETDVLQRLLAGHARKTIAAQLQISQHTVNDHIKGIFAKTGVASVGQLRAHIYSEHFTPRT